LSTVSSTELQQIVVDAIAAAAGVAPGEVSEERVIFELGLDSIDFWSVLLDVEDRVGDQVPSEVLDQLAAIDDDVTVGRLLAVVSGWRPAGGHQG
jgi:acyl carrier protein